MRSVSENNRKYYDSMYCRSGPLSFLFRGLLSYDQVSKSRANIRILDPFLQRMLSEKRTVRILDYGCGWGTFLFRLPRRSVELFGYDISMEGMRGLSGAMEFMGRNFQAADIAEDGRIVTGGFDVIVCSHVLEHMVSDKEIVRSMAAALVKGGYLLLNVPINEQVPDCKHARKYDEKSLSALVTSSGIKVVKVEKVDQWSAVFVRASTGNNQIAIARLGVRIIRALFALIPGSLVTLVGDMVLKKEKPQQLVLLGTRE